MLPESNEKDPEWKFLYPKADISNSVNALIMNSCVINKHQELFELYLEKEVDPNE